MSTYCYTLRVDPVLGLDRPLDQAERRRLRIYIAKFLNREFKLNIALDHVTRSTVRITGACYFDEPRS